MEIDGLVGRHRARGERPGVAVSRYVFARSVLLTFGLLPALAAAQVKIWVPTPTPQGGGSVRVWVPTPTPTHKPGGVAPTVVNIPTHSPDRLEFGAVWDGEKQVRTFDVTSNGKGYLVAEIPKGPFHIVEYREFGLPIRSRDGQKVGKNLKIRIPYGDNESRTISWQIDPDVEVQIDVAFNPKFDLASMTAGEKTWTLKVSGPGPYAAWQLGIPLHGVFHGLRGGVLLRAGGDVDVVEPDTSFRKTVTLVGAPDRAITGVLHASVDYPPVVVGYVTANDVTVTVPAGKTIEATITFQLRDYWHGGAWNRGGAHMKLDFTAGGATSTDTFQYQAWPSTFQVDTWNPRDCGPAGPMTAFIRFTSDGYITFQAWWNIEGFTKDPATAVHFQFLARGALVAEAIFPKTQMSSSYSSSNPSFRGHFSMRFSPNNYVSVYEAFDAGKVNFACRTVPGNTLLP